MCQKIIRVDFADKKEGMETFFFKFILVHHLGNIF